MKLPILRLLAGASIIDVSNNEFKGVSKAVAYMKYLTKLNIDENPIPEVLNRNDFGGIIELRGLLGDRLIFNQYTPGGIKFDIKFDNESTELNLNFNNYQLVEDSDYSESVN